MSNLHKLQPPQPAAPHIKPSGVGQPDGHGANGSALLAMQFILKLESDVRATTSAGELGFVTVNGARKLTNARQVFLFKARDKNRFETVAISSAATVDRNSPLVLWIERVVSAAVSDGDAGHPKRFAVPAYCDASDAETSTYPFREMFLLPLKNKAGASIGLMLLAKEQVWADEELPLVARYAGACAYSWEFLNKRSPWDWKRLAGGRVFLAGSALVALVGLYPVPMTALAPAEVVARAPAIVAAPIDGIIDDIVIEPSTRVKSGDVLFRFNDTQARNAAEVAEREVQVAEAKLRQVKQGAFVDATFNREIAITEADLAVKRSERDFARDVLAKSTVRADRDGLVLYADKRDLIGRPMSIGQRIMEIANPDDVALRILVAVDDASVIEKNSDVRVFLDSDPLHPLVGQVSRTSHVARINEGTQLSFRIDAIPELTAPRPRLGLRGTAQVFGARTPLAYYLFRRPLSYVRQKLGV